MAILTLWVLGAPDAEMTMIEAVLQRCGQKVVYAMKDGHRVTAAEAYKAQRIEVDEYRDLLCMVFVECSTDFDPPSLGKHLFDHHRPQTPGFGKPAAEALAASSLGQTLCWLSLLFSDHGERPPLGWSDLGPATEGPNPQRATTSGVIGTAVSGGELCCRGRWLRVPDELRYVAAADHCLWAAYRGDVPGVQPEAFGQWRVNQMVSAEKSAAVVMQEIEQARTYLRNQVQAGQLCYYHADGSPPSRSPRAKGQSEAVIACERGAQRIQEAAAREGLALLYPIEKGSSRRWVLYGARPATVRCWMDRQQKSGKKVVGFPELGYASVPM